MKKYYTNAPCNTEAKDTKKQSRLPLIAVAALLFTLLRAAFLMTPVENGGFEEIAVMAFSQSTTELAEDFGYLPTETAIEASTMPHLTVIPLKGTVTSGFNQREDPFGTGEIELHKGIDISAAYDTRIVAFAGGRVKKVGYSASYGYYVILSHTDGSGNDYETLYAHCEKILAAENEYVSAGDEIAVAGSTGRSTGRHLHFEVRINGNAVNPTKWLELAK